MTVESEVYARLSGFAGLTALVGTNIYELIDYQDAALPAVVFQRISEVRASNFAVDTGDVTVRIQISCYGAKAAGTAAVHAVEYQVLQALQRYSSGNIRDIFVEGGGTGWEPEAKIHVLHRDFMVHYKES